MSTQADIDQAAADSKEAAGIMKAFAKGDAETQVDNGLPDGIPSLAKFIAEKDAEFQAALPDMVDEATDRAETAATNAEASANRVDLGALDDAVAATAADVAATGDDVIQVAADKAAVLATKTDVEALAASADVSAQVAQNTKGLYPDTTKALSNGVAALTGLVGGSGGTDGTFPLAFSGGAGSKAAGVFVVDGGAVVSTMITYPGYGYTSAPTVSFAASTGLTGASATAVIAANTTDGQYFNVPDAGDAAVLQLWQNVGGVATDTGKRTLAATALAPFYTTDTIGRPSIVAGSANASQGIYIFAEPATINGQLTIFRAYNGYVGSRELAIKIFSKSGTDWTQIGDDVNVTLAVGANDIAINPPIAVATGQYVGIYSEAAGFSYLPSTTGDSGGHYSKAGSNSSSVSAPSFVSTIQLQIGFDIKAIAATADKIASIDASIADISDSAQNSATFIAAISTAQTLGRSTTPATSDNFGGNNTFAYADPLTISGYLNYFAISSPAAKTIAVRRFARDGDTFRQVGDDLILSVEAGLNEYTTADFGIWNVQAGEYLGFWAPANGLYYNTATADGLGWYAGVGDVTEFTDATPTTTLRLESRFQVVGVALGDPASAVDAPAVRAAGTSGWSGYLGRAELPFDNSTAKTFRLLTAVPAYFDTIRVVAGHGSDSALVIAGCHAKAVGAVSDISATSGFTSVTWDGGNVGASVAGRNGTNGISLKRSDAIPLSSVDRTDGGTYPLILVDLYVSSSALVLMGKVDGTTDRTDWATHPDSEWISRYNDGDCVTTPASFLSTTNRSTSPIAFVEFVARGQVITVASIGDSIANGEGGGITYDGASFGFEAARLLNTVDGVCYSHINLAWSGSVSETFLRRLQSALDAGIVPDVALIPCWTPNDIASSITAAQIATMRQRMAAALAVCQRYGIRPIIWTGLPTNTSVKDYAGTDSVRRGYNDAVRGFAARGIVVADFAAKLSGAAVSDQVQYIDGKTTDGIHPNDSGISDLAGLLKNAIEALALEWTGQLVIA